MSKEPALRRQLFRSFILVQSELDLGLEKAVNVPRSNLQCECLTSKDLMGLDSVACDADITGSSFVRDAGDTLMLCHELARHKIWKMVLCLKNETRGRFENLPSLLMEAMKMPNPWAL